MERKSNIPIVLAILMFALQFGTAWNYGIMGDEFYYIACSKHLDFGYVDHPPLVAVIARATRILFGESYIGLRFITALAAGASVLLTAANARCLGGKKFAQAFAALAFLTAPAYWAISSFYSMNVFDMLIFLLAIHLLIRIFKEGRGKLWLTFGLVAGLGLQNKLSMLVFGFALFGGLLLTKQRRHLASRWPYLGGIIAFLIFLPNLIWQAAHGWPTLEFIHNTQQFAIQPVSAVEFLIQLILALNPLSLPVWIAGLLFLLTGREGKIYRSFGFLALLFIGVYMVQRAKFYYVFPITPLLLSAGAVALERAADRLRRGWIRTAAVFVLALSGIALVPIGLAILPMKYFIPYSNALGIVKKVKMHRGDRADLPVYVALKFGWKEMVEAVAEVYRSLPEEEQKVCCIYASNYAKAGAIEYYEPEKNLPGVISGDNNYWFWGPGDYSGEVTISVGYPEVFLKRFFGEVEFVRKYGHPYAANWEIDQPIFICRKPVASLAEMWPELKSF